MSTTAATAEIENDSGVNARVNNVIFDIGNVIVAWEPFRALQSFYATEAECHAALHQLDFADWNREQDRGRSWEDAIAAAAAHEARDIFAAYAQGLEAAHSRRVEGTSELIARLLQEREDVRVGGCTNASLKTVSIMKQTAPILHQLHNHSRIRSDASGRPIGAGIVVSAEEGVVKPDPAIFKTCLSRFNIVAEETLFVDDSLANCQGARSVGMKAHHFHTADKLEAALQTYGLLS